LVGLPFATPKYIAIEAIINSHLGRQAAEQAVTAGIPPLCGVDSLLTSTVIGYGSHDDSTATAGCLIKDLMLSLGYEPAGRGPCSGCTAKSGLRYSIKPNAIAKD